MKVKELVEYLNNLNGDMDVADTLIELERYKRSLEKISKTVANGNYEGAYWDIILESDAALYPDEYSRKDDEDGRQNESKN